MWSAFRTDSPPDWVVRDLLPSARRGSASPVKRSVEDVLRLDISIGTVRRVGDLGRAAQSQSAGSHIEPPGYADRPFFGATPLESRKDLISTGHRGPVSSRHGLEQARQGRKEGAGSRRSWKGRWDGWAGISMRLISTEPGTAPQIPTGDDDLDEKRNPMLSIRFALQGDAPALQRTVAVPTDTPICWKGWPTQATLPSRTGKCRASP